ncbi:hypothetical protein Pfo_005418 [Paulownia fortunei]|nr:hypothetical protein Pfo_005418 [Paulownia fortunei]
MDLSSSGHQSSSTTNSLQSSVRGKTNAASAHFKEDVVVDGKKILTYLHCNNVWRGWGINRTKKHLAGRKRDIAPCKKVSYDVRYQMEQSLKECDKKNQAARSFEDDNLYGTASQKGKRKQDEKMSSYFDPRTISGEQPSIKSALVSKETLHNVDMAVARFFYDSCIPINAVNSIYFQQMVDVIVHEKKIQLVVDGYRSIWEEWGCAIMADDWQDQSNRQLINFLVLVDTSDIVKNTSAICNLFVELVQWVGPSNIIHLKYPSITWSPCAAHYLNLILGDIGKMELVPTHFATTFIALKSILEHQHDLQAFFTSKTFKDSQYFKDKKTSFVVVVVLDTRFWSDCAVIVGIFAPVIHLLCIMDTDRRPSIGYIVHPFTSIIKTMWDKQLRRDIHATTYLLNPTFAYDKEKMCTKKEIMDGFIEMVTTLIRDKYVQRKCIVSIFQDRLGSFNQQLAFDSSKSNPICIYIFERIHTKKRNRLEHQRLNDLVFVHYNLHLKERLDIQKNCYNPINYKSINKIDFWVMEEEEENSSPMLDIDELNNMLYGEESLPRNVHEDEDLDKLSSEMQELHYLEELFDESDDEDHGYERMVQEMHALVDERDQEE